VRVVAGKLKGRGLQAPRGLDVRPTADRVREAAFQVLGNVEGLHVLDLFAGTGALGIEAISRGAADAVFVDSDPRAIAAVRRNLKSAGIEAHVHKLEAIAFLATLPGPFDLVFVDPPYSSAHQLAGPLAERLPPVLSDDARIVCESDKRDPLGLSMPQVFERAYGDTLITIHRVG
jgi:16S rRNA (guanine966-N2)-methyltransferase